MANLVIRSGLRRAEVAKVYSRTVLDGLSDWWNDVELWVLQLPFALQFAMVIAVLMPTCVVAAWLIDRAIDWGTYSARLGKARDEHPLGSRAGSDQDS